MYVRGNYLYRVVLAYKVWCVHVTETLGTKYAAGAIFLRKRVSVVELDRA